MTPTMKVYAVRIAPTDQIFTLLGVDEFQRFSRRLRGMPGFSIFSVDEHTPVDTHRAVELMATQALAMMNAQSDD